MDYHLQIHLPALPSDLYKRQAIDGLKGITRIDLCVCDTEGKVLATTFPDAEEYENSILAFVDSPADSQVIQGYQFFKVFDEHQLEYILLAKGGSDDEMCIRDRNADEWCDRRLWMRRTGGIYSSIFI